MSPTSCPPRVAMFLGAGASKAFGLPLTAEILPTILLRLKRGSLFRGRHGAAYRKRLRTLFLTLFPGIEHVDSTHVLVTEVLSIIDYMIASACVPAPLARRDDLQECRTLLERAIVEILDWPHDPRHPNDVPSELLRLSKWMFEIGAASSFSLISTNYDEVIETELYRHFLAPGDCNRPFDQVNCRVNFGISWRDSPSGRLFHPSNDARHSVLKLHGSVDWMRCDLCGWVICNDAGTFQPKQYYASSQIVHSEATSCSCGHWPLRPVIVAPSLARGSIDAVLTSVWNVACEQLRTAEQLYFIGYSMPIEDYAIRAMLVRALNSRSYAPQIAVYQLGNNVALESRYRALCGPWIKYSNHGMLGFIKDVVDTSHLLRTSRP